MNKELIVSNNDIFFLILVFDELKIRDQSCK
jgi:hypothetical protein